MAACYQLGYFYFYIDEAQLLLLGVHPKPDQMVAMFDERGQININEQHILAFFGLSSQLDSRRDSAPGPKRCFGLGAQISEFVRVCWQEENSRKMLIFVTINLLFMFVELGYGVYSNSLGLISDSFHMLSDCISLFVALGAAYVASNKANSQYTYGF